MTRAIRPASVVWRTAAAALAVGVLAAGCADTPATGDPAPALTSGTGGLDLAASCPSTIVVQAPWWPEAEHGAIYGLVGPGYTVDGGKKKVTGPLVSGGKDTGVKIEVRAGGPAISFQNAGAQMYVDPSITLGMVSTDDAIGLSAKQPVTAVVAPFDIAPYMIMWDPASHPDFQSVVDIGKTDTKVLYFRDQTYMEYLIGSGILKRSQVDGSYDGSPTRWLAEQGTIAQQGFATNEPYIYEKELGPWKKAVKFQLIHELGYPIYPESVVIRTGDTEKLSACLRKLVPIIQRSQVDYVAKPEATNDLIIKLVKDYKGFPYTKGNASSSVEQQLKLGIVSNGGNGTLGDFDLDRVKKTIEIVVPIYKGQRKELKEAVGPNDLVTNEFIDPAISLPAK